MKKRIHFITYTAVLLALALLAQSIRFVIPGAPSWLVGTLVNAVLAYAALCIGLSSAAIVAVVVPLVAFLQGQIPILHMLPAVALGNLTLTVLLALLRKHPFWLYIPIASVAKFLVLFLLVAQWLAPSFIAKPPQAAAVAATFGIMQLYTALAGCVIAFLISIRFVPKPGGKNN